MKRGPASLVLLGVPGVAGVGLGVVGVGVVPGTVVTVGVVVGGTVGPIVVGTVSGGTVTGGIVIGGIVTCGIVTCGTWNPHASNGTKTTANIVIVKRVPYGTVITTSSVSLSPVGSCTSS